MKIDHTDIIDAPVKTVYNLVKQQLPDIVPYLPNIKKIDKIKEQKKSKKTILTNHWFANLEAPRLLKKVLSEDLFSWKDIATWDDSKLTVDYCLESFVGNDLFSAKGKNYFSSTTEGNTQLRLTCHIEIHAEKLPGIPKIMAKKITPAIESLIEKMLQPNVTSLGEGIRGYLANQR